MKTAAKYLIALALVLVLVFISAIIGHYTVGYERVYGFIGGIAIGYECCKIAEFIIGEITGSNGKDI